MFLTGCGEQEDVRVYRAPAEPAPESRSAGHDAAGGKPHVHWVAPDHWIHSPDARAMRVATFEAPDEPVPLEIAVTAFPGDTGGLLANINRWRQQLGLPAVDEQDMARDVQPFQTPSIRGWMVRIDGASPGDAYTPRAMVGAIIPGADDQTWFVRADGDPDLVERHQADIFAFARSFHFVAGDHNHRDAQTGPPTGAPDRGAASSLPPNHPTLVDHTLPPGHPAIDASMAMPHGHFEPAEQELVWEQPEHWTPQPSRSAIVYATFSAGPDAMITVTPLRGGGGELLLNINMWRSMLELPPLAEADPRQVQAIDVAGRSGRLVDAVTPDDPATSHRTLVGIVPDDDRTWYMRLSGTTEAVLRERELFMQFIESVRFE